MAKKPDVALGQEISKLFVGHHISVVQQALRGLLRNLEAADKARIEMNRLQKRRE